MMQYYFTFQCLLFTFYEYLRKYLTKQMENMGNNDTFCGIYYHCGVCFW